MLISQLIVSLALLVGGAALALRYGARSRQIGQQLVNDGVARNAADVNTVLLTGFFIGAVMVLQTAAQFIRFGDGPTDGVMVDNAEWLVPWRYVDFLREIGRHFKINEMIKQDSVRLRLEKEQGLSFLEFNYMLLQAYDFLELRRRYGCRLQMGGDGNKCRPRMADR